MAGYPPADAAQPSGINGIIVMVVINVAQEPAAPRIPSLLFLKPKNKSAPNSHSETPKNQLAPRTRENRVHPGNKRAVADKRNQRLRLIVKPLLVAKKEEDDYHGGADQVVVKMLLQNTRPNRRMYESVYFRIM
jgi:hypothetical protein